MGDGGITLQTIVTNVGTLTGAVVAMYNSFSTYWFVFLPLTFVVMRFIFGMFKSLLMYRGRRRGRG